jgi:putative Ca2+/H+ antiporter (TMEM165/GDT1 family)
VFRDMAGAKAGLCPGGEAAVSLSALLGVYPVVFLGELPDKTMFASPVLSTKGRSVMVWRWRCGLSRPSRS